MKGKKIVFTFSVLNSVVIVSISFYFLWFFHLFLRPLRLPLHAPKNWKSITKTEEKRFFFITECGSSQLFLYKRRILKLTTQLLLIEKRAPPNSVYYRSNSSRNRQRYSWELQFSFSLKSAQWSVYVVLVGYRKKQNVVNINTSMPIDIPYSFS